MSQPPPSDRDLLRAVYQHLDRTALLGEFPAMDAAALDDFFSRLCDLVPEEAAPEPDAPPAAIEGAVILYSDGGSRGNPGPAGYGVVMTDGDGNTLREAGESIGHATNNEAEYRGLIAGLEMACASGASDVLIRSDSELLVRQLQGAYKVKSPRLKPLFTRARSLLAALPRWRAEHVRRHLNTRADALANQAMDEA